ncbi:deoxynucleoside kinase [Saccharicrinis sp. FJH62]|uniref:deoxynucleoside kinase n=1 Tax=Saccharicrinis sp. FJH62 TaxID=3344657 RepID=UPI0035D3E4A9
MIIPDFLVIEGNIGVGKTTLANLLKERFGGELLLERFAENPFLPLFYENPDRYAFQLELSFMADRYNQIRNIADQVRQKKQLTIADYYFTKSLIFASVTLKDEELNLFEKLFDIARFELKRPDLFVYLYSRPEVLLENIRKRGRSYESGISKEYLSSISEAYKKHLDKVDFPVLYIDVSEFDFVENKNNFNTLVELMFGITYSNGVTIKELKSDSLS